MRARKVKRKHERDERLRRRNERRKECRARRKARNARKKTKLREAKRQAALSRQAKSLADRILGTGKEPNPDRGLLGRMFDAVRGLFG